MIDWSKVEEGYTLSKIRQMQIEEQKQEIEKLHSIIKEVREYIKNLTNFHIGYGLNENDIERTMYASENNFVEDILEILDKENR